ncbi:MuF-C-terminal domain-containing protein [Dysosmobacter sp.]|uniref:MuF-C-terminal domain-containing protein n=1 Tax=Dysosmobacter sp. TaxID=2591382 RepID=UPI002F92A6E2
MAVKMPDLIAYGERVNKTQNNSGGVRIPDLVAYGKRVETQKAKKTRAVTPSVSPRPMENASTGNSRPNSRLLADVRTGGTTPPSLDNGRVGKVISGAAKSTGSAYANLGGVLAEGAGKLNTRIANQNAGESLQSDHDAVKRYEKMLRDVKWANGKAMTAADVKQVQGYLASAKRRIAAHEGYTKAVERSDKAVADKAYQKADRLSQSSAADVAQAKEGLGPVGQFAVDLGVQGVQMAGDVAASAVIPGAGLALMTARSAGSSAQRARQAGANYNQQLAYGLGSGALSLATEKISNVASPFKKAFGGGVLDNAISGALAKMNNSTAGRVALSMISEGGEEFIEDIFQPVLQRATYDPSARFDLSESLYDAAVGAAMGGIGAGADVIRQRGSSQADAQPAQEARPEVREGTYTPAPANAAEGTQNAVPGVETAGRLTSTDNMLRYRSDIDKVFSGDYPSGKLLSVGDTPELLTRYGANPLPMTMTQDAAYKIAYPEGYMGGKHNLGMSVLKQLPYQIENPVAILKSNTQPSSIVLLTAWKDGDKSVIVPLHLDKQGAISVENRIASAYQTGHMQSYLGEADSNVLYTKNNEDVHQLLSNGVQFPKAMADDILAKNNISQAEAKSNRDILSEVLFGKKRADMDAMTPEQQNAIYQANEAGTVGMDATGKVFQIDPELHIDRRRMETVGGRDVNAFQFDHPELHRYYQEAANALIADADLSLQQPMSRRYERTMEGNAVQQAAQTSPHLRQAMDETGLSRDAIIDAAQRIITDQGQENVAAAKRVELILDDMLSHGYTTMTGEQVGPNSGYLTAKQSILGAGEQARGRGLDDVDAFDTPGDAVAGAVNTPFDAMQAKSDEFYLVNPNSAQRIQAEQRRAPSEVPVVNPDTERNVEKTVSTILNSPMTSPEMATVYENAIAGGAFDYDVVTDRGAVQQAQAKIARDGWQEVANSFIAKAELGQRITKADTAEAISAYNLAISEGDHKAAFELATAIAEAAHDSAQMVQAMNLMNRLTPEGRLLTLRRLVDRMNDRAARQNRTPRQSTADSGDVEGARVDYIDKVTGFTLSDELATNYLMAETDAERAAAWDAITTSIADQIPSTFREKANFWRYTSMLTNPTTHIRNIMGNAIQFGARKIKDGIGTAIERAVIKDPSQRTKAVNVDKDLKAFAKGQYETDQSAAMGSGKYSDATAAGIEREIQSKRKMFRGEDGLSRAVQGIGDLNSRALDYEDVIFNRSAYVDSFAQALQAKGVTAAEAHAGTRAADVEAARAYAIEEAQKATYRNTTALSEALSQFGRYEGDNPVKRAGSFVADALFPFRKTPANILTTGLDYSPVGLAKGIKEAMFDVKSGKCTAADAVDSIASGLTGTGILALGAYLAAEGFFGATLHVRAGDDDKEEAFEKSMGGQDYAIQIGDKSYTLDWMTPAAMPLFAGAATMKSVQKGGSTFDALVDSLLGMQDVVLETSMLSSLNDLISYWSYADNKVGYLLDRAASSYAGQYIPTIGSKVASVFDDTVRKSYVEKGSGQVASDVNYFLQGAAKKVPGARNQLQPMVDMWGNEVSNGSAPERVFQSFLSPGFLKAQDNSPATQEIRRLAKATGDSTVYPAAAEKSYTVKGETWTLTGEEYTRYAKAMGQTRKELVEAAVKLPAYKSMSDSEKSDYIQNVYKYARETARQQVDPKYEPSAKWIENAKTSKRDIGVSTGEFLALYQKYGSEKMSGKAYEKVKQAHDAGLSPKEYFSMKDRADANGNGRVSKAEASAALAGQENRADLWDIICTTNAKNPYK